jgi:predicted lipopolysaccharide heptosyltransferase III
MKILVIKLRYIGDTVLLTPALRAIKARHPDAHVAALVNDWTAPVLRNHPYLDEVIPFPRSRAKTGNLLGRLRLQWRFLRRLRNGGFDLVIDLTDADRSAICAFATGASRRIGFNAEGRWRGRLLTEVVTASQRQHIVDYHFAALRKAGIPEAGRDLFLSVDPAEAREVDSFLASHGVSGIDFLLLIHPGARWKGKCWPPVRFAEVAKRLATEHGAKVVLASGPDAEEQAILAELCRRMETPFLLFPQEGGLPRFIALCARSSLVIGNDSGPVHIAAAAGVPVVALFGPSLPSMWAPVGRRVATPQALLDCCPCGHTVCHRPEGSCMVLLGVDTVLEAVASVLAPENRPGREREGGAG